MLHLKLSAFTVTLHHSPELPFPTSSERLCANSVLKQAAVLLTSSQRVKRGVGHLSLQGRGPQSLSLIKSFHAANLLTGKEMPDEDKVLLGEGNCTVIPKSSVHYGCGHASLTPVL